MRNDHDTVVGLCQRYGFGFIMTTAAREWVERDPVGAITTGPCKTFTEPCGCKKTKDDPKRAES